MVLRWAAQARLADLAHGSCPRQAVNGQSVRALVVLVSEQRARGPLEPPVFLALGLVSAERE